MNNDEIYSKCKQYTLTSKERVHTLCTCINDIVDSNIDGDFVECGVYMGGSIIAMMLALQEKPNKQKSIHLYDTFQGMTNPTKEDFDLNNTHANSIMSRPTIKCKCLVDTVKANIKSVVNYPEELTHYHIGDVAQTLLSDLPEQISLLRLDTDFYESTKIELDILYPRLIAGGYLIIDDYGHWKGCKQAVDEYFKSDINTFTKIDYTGIYRKK